jgi:uncharacterized protein (DUF885 family)
VDYVVVRRSVTRDEGCLDEAVKQPSNSRYTSAQTVDDILNLSKERRDDDDYEDYGKDMSPKPVSLDGQEWWKGSWQWQVRVTMTIDQMAPTGTALANQNPSETTVVVMLSPAPKSDGRAISQTTEHLLIAAGSIGMAHKVEIVEEG